MSRNPGAVIMARLRRTSKMRVQVAVAALLMTVLGLKSGTFALRPAVPRTLEAETEEVAKVAHTDVEARPTAVEALPLRASPILGHNAATAASALVLLCAAAAGATFRARRQLKISAKPRHALCTMHAARLPSTSTTTPLTGAPAVAMPLAMPTTAAAQARQRLHRGEDKTQRASAAEVLETTTATASETADLVMAARGLSDGFCEKGVLSNGLRYVLLEHPVPPGRVELHLEFHVGSLEETETERGMAHMLEHICFLGSSRRRQLQSSGTVSSNALTDFHHTIYHMSLSTDQLSNGLECLREVGFEPGFSSGLVENERAAVLSEAQMRNDGNHRWISMVLAATNAENIIPHRQPIGLVEQISRWSIEELRSFHSKWYLPENATLYVVGDVAPDKVLPAVENIFGGLGGQRQQEPDAWAFSRSALFRPSVGGRKPVYHSYVQPGDRAMPKTDDVSPLPANSDLKVVVSQDELMYGMRMQWTSKMPLRAPDSADNLTFWLCSQLVMETVRLRVQSQRHLSKIPVDYQVYDSLLQGATLSSLSVKAGMLQWRDHFTKIITEAKTIVKHGIQEDEMQCTIRLVLNKLEQAARRASRSALMGPLMWDGMASTSREVVEAVIEATPAGHLLARAEDFFEATKAAASTLTLEELNQVCRQLLGNVGAEAGEATGIVVVACPLYELDFGSRVKVEPPSAQDVAAVIRAAEPLSLDEVQQRCLTAPERLLEPSEKLVPVKAREVSPSGVVSFRLPNGLKVRVLVRRGGEDTTPESSMRLVAAGGRAWDVLKGHRGAVETGLKMLEFCGIGEWSQDEIVRFARLNSVSFALSCHADAVAVDAHFAPSQASFRAALEWLYWLLEKPCTDYASFGDAQIQLRSIAQEVEKSIEGMSLRRLQELMYPSAQWLFKASATDVSRLTMRTAESAISEQLGNLEDMELLVAGIVPSSSSGSRAGNASSGGLSHDEAELDGSASQEHGSGPEAEEEHDAEALQEMQATLEEEIRRIMGQLPGGQRTQPAATQQLEPVMARQGGDQRVHIPDSQTRGLALIGGGAPGFWGEGDDLWEEETKLKGFAWGDAERLKNRFHPAMAMEVMAECMNVRLLSRLRDSASLTYTCDLNLHMYDTLRTGYFVCKLYTSPADMGYAIDLALSTLKSPESIPFTSWEVESAKKVVAMREASARRERGYLLDKLTGGSRSSSEPWKDPEEERAALEALTVTDVQRAHSALTRLDDPFIVMGTSGPGGPTPMAGPSFQRSRSMASVAGGAAQTGQKKKVAASGMAFLD